MKTPKLKTAIALCALVIASSSSYAGTANSTTIISSQINAVCNLSVPATVDVGSYHVGTAPTVQATGLNVEVQCTSGTNFILTAASANPGNGGQYQLSDGNGHLIAYGAALSFDPTATTQVNAVSSGGGGGSGTAEGMSVEMRILVGDINDAPAGSYTDTLTFTVTY